MDRLFLRKSQRIVSGEHFQQVLNCKCFVCKGIMRIYAARNVGGFPRFGISIGKACGPAVTRNRLKRLAREVFRRHQHEIPADFDYVLIFTQKMPKKGKGKGDLDRNEAQSLQFADIERRVLGMIDKLRTQGRLDSRTS